MRKDRRKANSVRLKAGYTVEASLLFPIILVVILALVQLCVWLHDRVVVQSVLQQAGSYLVYCNESGAVPKIPAETEAATGATAGTEPAEGTEAAEVEMAETAERKDISCLNRSCDFERLAAAPIFFSTSEKEAEQLLRQWLEEQKGSLLMSSLSEISYKKSGDCIIFQAVLKMQAIVPVLSDLFQERILCTEYRMGSKIIAPERTTRLTAAVIDVIELFEGLGGMIKDGNTE